MPRIPFLHTRASRLIALGAVAVLLAVAGVVWARGGRSAPPVRTQEAVIEVPAAPGSAARIPIDTTLYLPRTTPAPAVLLAHGFGGDKTGVDGQARELADRGFVVLAWSARGFGHSGGKISLDDPDYEVADASRLIDYLATRHEVLTGTGGDPKIGVTGASYGGALALLLAGTDRRVDAIAPVITYNDLGQALLPDDAAATPPSATTPAASAPGADGVFKKSWAGILFSAGSGAAPGGSPAAEAPEAGQATDESGQAAGGGGAASAPPAPAQGRNAVPAGAADPCGRFTPQVCEAYTELATTGHAGPQTSSLLRRVSPASVTNRIKVPTLLVQGETDTLFGLDQADRTARQITAAGGRVSVIWYTGGHDGGSPGPQLRARIADFLWYQLTGQGSDPGTNFRYDVQGTLRAGGSPSVRTVDAPAYPGLTGGGTQRRTISLAGRPQEVVHPATGNPPAVSGIPGLNGLAGTSSRLAALFGTDPPGQSATFVSAPLDGQLVIAGSSTIRLSVAADPAHAPPTHDAVLFAKLYDIGTDGSRVLPANAVAPFRVPDLPADGTPADVTVTLPGIVRPVDSGHSLALVVGTTDQAYTSEDAPAVFRIGLASGAALRAPVVPGPQVSTGLPVGQLLGVAAALVVAAAVAVLAALRRRRSHRAGKDPSSTPLVITGLTKSYPGKLIAVDDLSFRVEPGQVLGLLGPNGAGKTTTLRMLMGLITATAGEIRVFGHRVTPGAPVLSRIGCFVEAPGFLPHLSGETNLRLYWDATGRPAEKAHLTEVLEIAGLSEAVKRRVKTYSHGMRQRLAIAQAMLGLPELLVLDEPTNGLDPPQIHRMREVLKSYAVTGRTVVVSSHLLAEVEQTCSHVVVMHRGRLVASGEVSDIVAGGGEATFRVDDPALAAEALRGVTGVSDVDVDGPLVHANLDGVPRAEAVAALVRAGVGVEQAGPRRRLEDAFLRLVGEEANP